MKETTWIERLLMLAKVSINIIIGGFLGISVSLIILCLAAILI